MHPLRLSVRALAFSALVVVASGCPSSRSKEPSADYEQARQRFSTLYAEKLDEAFVDPRLDEIEALLEKVPEDSIDAEAAKALKQRIDAGRAQAAADREELEDALEEARQPPTGFENSADPGASNNAGEAPAPAGTDDVRATDYPSLGMASGEIAKRFGNCFQPGTPLDVTGRGVRETWVLKGGDACSQQFPAFVDTTVVIENGKVLATVPNANIKPTTPPASTGSPEAPPAAPVNAADAGEGDQG